MDLRYEFAVFRSWKWAVAWSRVMPVRSELFLSGWYCKANILKAVFTSISVASIPSQSTPNESKRFRPTPSGSHCLLVVSSSLLALGGGRLPVLPCSGPDELDWLFAPLLLLSLLPQFGLAVAGSSRCGSSMHRISSFQIEAS